MWSYYNPNPQGKRVGDCTVRAISAALGVSWDRAFELIAKKAFEMKDMPSSDAVWGNVLRDHGFRRYIIPNTCPECYTAADFAASHPNGVYILGFGGHVATVKSGILMDTWRSSKKVPIFYYKK